jgi:alkyl sulfatase BDS1-like metallo-beta-lactamase superfamily hydrolase
MGWIDSLDHMRLFDTQFLFPSHTRPVVGDDIYSALTIYRDAIQFVHDQTVRLMNEGLYPDQIVEMIDLPDEIKNSPFLKEFYGTVRWSVKSIYNGYLGWFNGNPADLDPLSRTEEAIRFSKLLGGNEELLLALKNAINEEDMQWALQLSDRLIALDYELEETMLLRKQALIYIGERSSNPNKRNYLLTSAIELNRDFKGFPESERSEDLVNEISIDTLFNILSVRLNPENFYKDNYSVCFNFLSGLNKTITLRNKIAEISDKTDQCDISVKSSELEFKLAISGLKNPVQSIAAGDISVEGGNIEFLQFLSSFK